MHELQMIVNTDCNEWILPFFLHLSDLFHTSAKVMSFFTSWFAEIIPELVLIRFCWNDSSVCLCHLELRTWSQL